VRAQVEAGNDGRIVAIDIETGAFEVANEVVTDSERLLERIPDAQTWFIRIAHRSVYNFGANDRLMKFIQENPDSFTIYTQQMADQMDELLAGVTVDEDE
jgi:hypothetical protein